MSKHSREITKRFAIKPIQFLPLSFFLLIIIGTFFLSLPFATKVGHLSFIDALFTSTSSVCVTGLIVVDTATYFTRWGQIIILILIQLGGLGIMTLSSLFVLILQGKVSLKNQLFIEESLNQFDIHNLNGFLVSVVFYTLIVEAIGGILLFMGFGNLSGTLLHRVFFSLFHSVSAFCNAGFSVFSNSLMSYQNNLFVNIVVMALIVLGGIGFFVAFELKNFFFSKQKTILTLHTKVVLSTTLFLIVMGFLLIALTDIQIFGFSPHKILSYLFLSITARTAGFNTVNIGQLAPATLLVVIILMFIGGAPGSTAGGVKVTTIALLYHFLRSKIMKRNDVELYYRRIPHPIIDRTFLVLILSILLLFFNLILLGVFQRDIAGHFLHYLFELFSALGTVGLSMGATNNLTLGGKIVIIITMFLGRIGPSTLIIALAGIDYSHNYKYPEGDISVG